MPRLPRDWHGVEASRSASTVVAPGVSCTPVRSLFPGDGAPGHRRLAIAQLVAHADEPAALRAMIDGFVRQEQAHAVDVQRRMLRWVRVHRADDGRALTSVSLLVQRISPVDADLFVGHVAGDLMDDDAVGASIALAEAIAATIGDPA